MSISLGSIRSGGGGMEIPALSIPLSILLHGSLLSPRPQTVAATDSVLPSNDSLFGRTVVGVAFEPEVANRKIDAGKLDGATDLDFTQTIFKVRLADHGKRSSTAGRIVQKMYAWRGYKVAWHAKPQPHSISLVGSHGSEAVVTITVGFDSPDGLKVDALYQDEVDALRATGARVCEYTQLALDGVPRSRDVLASMFNIAFLYAYRMHHHTDLLIEVNPRHVRFYKQMLGFEQRGPLRVSPRVNAPAVLMHLPLSHTATEIDRFRQFGATALPGRSLYSHAFSARREAEIIERLRVLV